MVNILKDIQSTVFPRKIRRKTAIEYQFSSAV